MNKVFNFKKESLNGIEKKKWHWLTSDVATITSSAARFPGDLRSEIRSEYAPGVSEVVGSNPTWNSERFSVVSSLTDKQMAYNVLILLVPRTEQSFPRDRGPRGSSWTKTTATSEFLGRAEKSQNFRDEEIGGALRRSRQPKFHTSQSTRKGLSELLEHKHSC